MDRLGGVQMAGELTSRWALRCKYCGQEVPFLEFTEGAWSIVGQRRTLNGFVHRHSHCQEKDGVMDDRQPFLLSGS